MEEDAKKVYKKILSESYALMQAEKQKAVLDYPNNPIAIRLEQQNAVDRHAARMASARAEIGKS